MALRDPADEAHAIALLICLGLNRTPTSRRTSDESGATRTVTYLDLVMPAAELIAERYVPRSADA